MTSFEIILLIVSIIAGSVASISGFGIGSLLTPLLILKLDAKIAIAVVSVPHLIATSLRFWMLRQHIDKKVLLHFGILSAIGGLLGALLNSAFQTSILTLLFGFILVFAGFTGLTGLNEKFRFGPKTAWLMGTLSGILGGLVGNQGGIRSAALLGFKISPSAFVATATAVGIIVDGVRMPIYFAHQASAILDQKTFLIVSILGVVAGTFLGMLILKRLPEKEFKRIVSGLMFGLGLFMIYKGLP